MTYDHIPVLLSETISLLQPEKGGLYIDGTVGAGGHSAGILAETAPNGKLLGFDRDPEAIQFASQRLSQFNGRATLIVANYAQMAEIAPEQGFHAVDGILLDIGISSRQLDNYQRGFSFQHEGPLDMRFNPNVGQPAEALINNLTEAELAEIFWRYGEERHSRRIAKAIVLARPLFTTKALATVIAKTVRGRRGKHPATLVFQALRIVVNDELNALADGINAGIHLLKSGGRMVIISFHSLEDRIVKQTFRQLSKKCVCPPTQPICTCDKQPQVKLITRKVVRPTEEEISRNPRSRSAKLRSVEKI